MDFSLLKKISDLARSTVKKKKKKAFLIVSVLHSNLTFNHLATLPAGNKYRNNMFNTFIRKLL